MPYKIIKPTKTPTMAPIINLMKLGQKVDISRPSSSDDCAFFFSRYSISEKMKMNMKKKIPSPTPSINPPSIMKSIPSLNIAISPPDEQWAPSAQMGRQWVPYDSK